MQVEVRVVGRRGPGIEPRELAAPEERSLSLRDLLAHVVRGEVAAFGDRQELRRFVRVLSPDEIAAGAAAGKVDSGCRAPTGPVDVEAAVATAIEAFADGLYLVLLDDDQVDDLDALVEVTPATRVRFVRLTALAGG
jgi:hypothetical protein